MAVSELPEWWMKIHRGLNTSIKALQRPYASNMTVLGFVRTEDEALKIVGYYLRDRNGLQRVLLRGKEQPVMLGGKVKGNPKLYPLDEVSVKFDIKAEFPTFESFVFQTLTQQVRVLPKVWLRRTIQERLQGVPVTSQGYSSLLTRAKEMNDPDARKYGLDYCVFKRWVYIPTGARNAHHLNLMLYHAASESGLGALRHQSWIWDAHRYQSESKEGK